MSSRRIVVDLGPAPGATVQAPALMRERIHRLERDCVIRIGDSVALRDLLGRVRPPEYHGSRVLHRTGQRKLAEVIATAGCKTSLSAAELASFAPDLGVSRRFIGKQKMH